MSAMIDMSNIHTDYDVSSAMLHASFENAQEAGLPAGLASQLERAKALLDQAIESYDECETVARRDLRPEVLGRHMADARRQAEGDIDRITSALVKELVERAEGLRARLAPKPNDMKDRIVLAVEYRQRLRAVDPILVQQVFLEACRTRDAVTIFAIESAPTWDRLVDAQTVEAGRRIVAELDNPDVISQMNAVERILGALESAVRTARRHCSIVDNPAGAPVLDEPAD